MLKVDIQIAIGNDSKKCSFEFENKSYIIQGANGIGKTTFLHALAGLNSPQSGRIQLNDDFWFHSENKIDCKAQKRNVGLVFQDKRLFPHITVEKNLLFGAQNADEFLKENLIEVFGLDQILDQKASKISGGEQQRLAIARAILTKPDVLILDEPFTSIDKSYLPRIIEFIAHYQSKENIPVLIVSHSLDQLTNLKAFNLNFDDILR